MLERRTLKRMLLPLPVMASNDSLQLSGITKDISKEGLCVEIPTPCVNISILELLNKNVTLTVKDVMLEGIIKWYTVNNSRYLIGILIDEKDKLAWKQIIEDKETGDCNLKDPVSLA
ncbi:MAG: PilZ domain-containing protein [Deltaproteobacteria bacterium]|nr:PilZ domain-containing protein [Deltaproteobacteria bacterium]